MDVVLGYDRGGDDRTRIGRLPSLSLALSSLNHRLHLLLPSSVMNAPGSSRLNQTSICCAFLKSGPIAGFLYKHRYTALLLILMLFSFAIRIYNLTILDPYTDEYNHLVGAIEIRDLGSTEYERAYFLTYLVYSSFELLGQNLLAARLPCVVFGALTIIPLYILASKISRPVGLISALLWATSPWAIGVSRNIREYAIFPFFMLIFVCISIYLIDASVDIAEKRRNPGLREASVLFIILLFFTYALVDHLSTFKFIFILLLPVTLYTLYRHASTEHPAAKLAKPLLALIILSLIAGLLLDNLKILNLTLTYRDCWIRMFWDPESAPIHWFYQSYLHEYISPLLVLSGALYGLRKRDNPTIYYLIIFASVLYVYIFYFERYAKPRYIFYIFPFYTILLSTGIYNLYDFITDHLHKDALKKATTLILVILLVITFNPVNTIRAVTYEEHGKVPITGEYHDKTTGLKKEYTGKINEDDVIISSLPKALIWLFDFSPDLENIYKYSYKEEDRFIKTEQIIRQNKHGWVILDPRRSEGWIRNYSKADFAISGKNVKLLDIIDGWRIYRW